jgi:predicted MPP superfamily phosphohydrolase
MPSYFFIFVLFTFFSLLATGLYTLLKTLAVQWRMPAFPALKIALSFTLVYLIVTVCARIWFPDPYRYLAYYLGVINFGFFTSVGFWLLYGLVSIFGKSKVFATAAVTRGLFLAVWLGTVVLSIYNFSKPFTVEEITLSSDRITREYRFAHVTDIQYGSITREQMEARMQRIYALQPEFIVFTGDLIDFDRYNFQDFNILRDSPVPIYFERGNHEFYHDPTRLLSFLQRIAPIHLLINQKAQYEELDLVGIDYGRSESHLAEALSEISLDDSRFSILLYHMPRGVQAAVDKGFSLALFGHTHAGQIWPFTHVVDWIYPYADGLFKVGNTTVYTSDGIALWGPRMRLNSQNEAVIFTLKPTE